MKSDGPYLFLQGPSSPLFARIADHLTASGQTCYRINFNVGDQIFWRRRGGFNYRRSFDKWGAFIRQFLREHSIQTVVLLGEERPYHKEAARSAKECGITVVAIEMGYLRPDWVTIELDGLSSNSRFPKDPGTIIKAAAGLRAPDMTRKYSQSFLAEAVFDMSYYIPSSFFWFLFPHYRFHGIYHPLAEYAGWIGRLLTRSFRERAAARLQSRLEIQKYPWFVYPLQLETDYQLRAHSPFSSQKEAIEIVIGSFARSADQRALLVIKSHPLDNGLISWRKIVYRTATKLGVSHRIFFFDGGDLAVMLDGASGMVTVNSTAALSALDLGLKTKVLGSAIYDIPGLTEQSSLDDFWRQQGGQDKELKSAFFRLLAASIQERGNFYSMAGLNAAAQALASRLVDGRINSPSGCVKGGRNSVQPPKTTKV